MPLESCLQAVINLDIATICLTNHGDLNDYEALAAMAPPELVLIPGVEISSNLGDFLIFSDKLDFLRSLEAVQPLPTREQRPTQTAVVWAHPFAGNVGGLDHTDRYVMGLAAEVDGIEVFNGNWPDDDASALARRIASTYGLAELGGSDAHRPQDLMRCWTEIDGKTTSVDDLIRAILDRKTVAHRKE
jgi:predicted metal-dependent phosphoesterase TrpH